MGVRGGRGGGRCKQEKRKKKCTAKNVKGQKSVGRG